MSEYHKMDTICIQQMSEYIRMPHIYQTNMCAPEIAQIQIQIIFKCIFIGILEYSYSALIEEIFEKGSFMLPQNKMLYWIFFMH